MKHTFRYRVEQPPAGSELLLAADDSHHLARVVRRVAGDAVELIDGDGAIWPATVLDPGPPSRVQVGATPRPAPPLIPLHLVVGLAEWGRLDLVAEKATELGVPSLTLFSSARTRRVPDAAAFASRRERLHRVGEAAARQSGRARGIAVGELQTLETVLATCDPAATLLVDATGERRLGEALRGADARPVQVIVGPDAGFAPAEIAEATARGVVVVTLGPAILRTETAAIAVAAVAADALASRTK